MTSHEFHSEALAEYEDAVHRYTKQQPGLGLRFIEAVEAEGEVSSICGELLRH